MAKINKNTWAKKVSEMEGKKVEVNIAQIKEVLRCGVVVLIRDHKLSEIVALLEEVDKEEYGVPDV